MSPPLSQPLALITLTWNNSADFERTARSVLAARDKGLAFRWIIVDGDSTPTHQALVRGHLSDQDDFYVETTRGIYPAMNRGLVELRGEHHGVFLNSGDCLTDEAATLLSELDPAHAYAFDAIIAAGPYAFRRVPLKYATGKPAMPMHGAFLFRTPDGQAETFDTKRTIDADSYWMDRMLARAPVHYIDQPTLIFALEGVSAGQTRKAVRALLRDKPRHKAPGILARYLGYKILGWHFYPLFYRGKFARVTGQQARAALAAMSP